jgi:hypothetical protein
MTPLALVVRALDALADGDLDLVRACLEGAEDQLRAQANRWVMLADVPATPDPCVLEEDA